MEFSYEMQGTKTFLVYTVPENEQLDMMSVGMLVNNRIPGLAQTIFTQMDHTRYLKYNISAMVQASQLFMSPISRRRFLGVLNGIGRAMLSAEEYMLDPGMILLDPGYMFSDVKTGETVLICVPVEGQGDAPVDLKDHIKRLMYDTAFDQSENCDYVTGIISFLNQSGAFSLPDFLEYLRRLESSAGPQPAGMQAVRQDAPQGAVQAPAPPPPQPYAPPPPPPQPCTPPPPPQPYTPPVNREAPPAAPEAPRFVQPPVKPPVPPVQPGPGASPVPPPANAVQAQDGDGKQMSLLYLLRHYNKENAEAYKAQKGKAPKEKKAPAEQAPRKKGKNAAPAGFTVPEGMAVPGAGPQMPAQVPVYAQASQTPAYAQVPQAPVQPPQAPVPQAPVPQAPPAAYPQGGSPSPVQTIPGANFGETSFYSDSDGDSETMVLGVQTPGQQQLTPHLVRRKNNERIPVDKPVFRLGRDADFNDYAILDNRYVGHSHCHLLQQEGEFFVVDDNSKNHTLVNGRLITPGQAVKIAHGYVISVADEEFEFKLY